MARLPTYDIGAPVREGWKLDRTRRHLDWVLLAEKIMGGDARYVPLWIPLIAAAVPTAFFLRAARRHRPGSCPQCGYDLTGAPSPNCPECGKDGT
jgi:hypothetical protein